MFCRSVRLRMTLAVFDHLKIFSRHLCQQLYTARCISLQFFGETTHNITADAVLCMRHWNIRSLSTNGAHMRMFLIAGVLMSVSGLAWSQGGGSSDMATYRQAMETFCSSHQQDCADLKQLRDTAQQACQSQPSNDDACGNARQAVRAKGQALQAEGLPARPAGSNMRQE